MIESPKFREEQLAALSKSKLELLQLLREQQSRQVCQIRPRLRTDDTAPPTSLVQRRLWFIDQLEGGSAGYTVLLAVRLRGILDRDCLERALDAIVQRHEILRTVFVSVGGEPVQVVLASARLQLRFVDLSAQAASEREAHVRHHQIEEAHEKFELRTGPLIRGRLLKLCSDEHVLLITLHHVLADGWSKGVLLGELQELYSAYREGRESRLKPLSLQYADYACWQRQQWLMGSELELQLTYWRKSLEGAPPELALPADRPRPVAQSFRGATVGFILDEQLTTGLKTLAQRRGMSLFMVLYAGLTILLSRLSGQQDVVVGSPIANRQRPELEPLIGCFVNTLALRIGVPQDLKLEQFLDRVKQVTLGAYDHQDVPFERVVEAVRPERRLSRSPLFQVMFVLHNWPHCTLQLPDLAAAVEEDVDEPAILDLWIVAEERDAKLVGSVIYATDLFDRTTVERWMACYAVILKGMTAGLRSRISELPILPEGERRQIESFNVRLPAFPQDRLIHELFEQQVERAPQALAVTFEGQSLTYEELNGRANQLARYLIDQGVGPDQLVGICMDRGLPMVVGLLGILKAGGAYVPLDPSYPAERLAYTIADAAPSVLLTEEGLKHRFAGTAPRVLALDSGGNEITQRSRESIASRNQERRSSQLAYVIYTSGSTGNPKGVMVEHRNVARLFSATDRWFGFNERDVWTLFHSFAFDFSVWELWGALLYGGRVVVVPYLTTRSPRDFYQLLCDERVTVLNQTPSAFVQLIDAQAQSPAAHALRVVVFGGEALELRTLRPWIARNGSDCPQLVNMYGITETTVHVTFRLLTAEDITSARGSQIGRPIPDLQIHLLDPQRQPVPIGVAGEIYVGGAGVARGYLNRAELTAARFLSDPFAPDPQARLYRSGDLGRWRADGSIEYHGRNDHQVKIRGFRIELGEIEAQLARHPQVKEAVVLAREDVPGQKYLVAYVLAHEGCVASPQLDHLRQHLAAVLPEHMVPKAFVLLERFPLTSNGKLDRAALPVPDERAIAARVYVEPRDELERALCHIWSDVVGLQRVGIEDNFFAIGGDSILSLRVLARAQTIGVSIEVADLFRNQNIARLAAAVRARGQEDSRRRKVAAFELLTEAERAQFEPVSEYVDAYPLSLLQHGMYFHSELARDSAVYHDIFRYRVSVPFEREQFDCAARSLVRRHPVLRTSLVMSCDHRPVQVVHGNVAVPLVVDDLTPLSPDAQDLHMRKWVEAEKHRGFTWSEPPLLRFVVHVLAADSFQYSLSFHHSILDGWSVASLHTELMNHYFDLLAGAATEPTAPRAVYRDYIAREQQVLQSAESQDFWRSLLRGATLPSLPTARDIVDEEKGLDVGSHTVTFDAALSRELTAIARTLEVHLKLLLLAAHVKVMSLIYGEQTVLTGLVWHGRLEEEDGERVLGLHLNSLPLRVEVGEGSWRALVSRVRDAEEAMLPHRYYPLAGIQELVRSERLFDTLFNFTKFHIYDRINSPEKVSRVEGFEQTSFSLLVNFSQDLHDPGVSLSISFDPALFAALQIERLAGYYQRALQSMVADIESRHHEVTLLGDSEQIETLLTFNGAAVPFSSDRLVHELFEDQVRKTPQTVAVECNGQSISYDDLNQRANVLARCLRDQGVGPDQPVAICIERSIEMVVGVLATLKAGGAYLPLDPRYPAERLQYMLEDAAPRLALMQKGTGPQHPTGSTQYLEVSETLHKLANYPGTNLPADDVGVTASNLVYVIYTSGSTGRPKGTAMPHRSMVNLIEWHRGDLHAAGVRVLQFAALSFDVAFQEIFSTLCTGGTLVLLDEWVRRDGRALAEFLISERIERLFLPPLMLQSLAEAYRDSGTQPCLLKDVITAGEQLRLSQEIRDLFARLTRCRLHNHYGPTESHVVTSLTLAGSPEKWPTLPPIGRPIANAKIYVLDVQRRPVPVGVSGEIYIGGAGLARGYLHQPELTRQRFVQDSLGSQDGAQLYRTGDVGRWRADGVLEYLGRNDDQVKIRGHRVELGEVEAQLSRHSQVRETAIAVHGGSGDKRLVAYIVPAGKESLDIDGLRSSLKALLPDHMMPSAFVILQHLPLTPSGKLDRRALPEPPADAYVAGRYEPPNGDVERMLAEIWQQLLRVDRVGRHDDFFDLGGHSLLATRVSSRIRERLGEDVALKVIFDAPTVAALAAAVGVARQARENRDVTRRKDRARTLHQEISQMDDEEVAAKIQELTAVLGHVTGRNVVDATRK